MRCHAVSDSVMRSNKKFRRPGIILRAVWLKPFLIFGVFLVAMVHTHAQPLFSHAESIESTVANADSVFIAKLEKFDDVKNSGEITRPGENEWHHATIAIEETLKQNLPGRDPISEPYRRLRVRVTRTVTVLADWQKRSSRLLVAIDEDVPNATTVIELMPAGMEMLTADFKLLQEAESVLRAAREAAHRMPARIKRIHTFDLQVPREIVAGTKWEKYYDTGGCLTLSVPVDQQLEKRAQDYVRSKSFRRRREGTKALMYFKSDENISLVRPLLNDTEITHVDPAYRDKPAIRVYGVRNYAYDTMKCWGIDVEKPVIREEVQK